MIRTQSRSPGERSAAGQSLVEFALIFPILILVIVAVFDVGRLVFAYNTITNAAREATRFGIVDQTDTLIKAEAVSQSTSLGIPAANVLVDFCNPVTSVCTTTRPTNLDALVRVRVSYGWTAITPIIGNLIGPKTITADSRMVIERVYP